MGLKDFGKRLTGQSVAEKVSEYSEIYGEVLLGMHRDMQRHNATIAHHASAMQEGLVTLNQRLATLDQTQLELSKNAARTEEVLANAQKCKDETSKYCKAASVASQNAAKAAAAAEVASDRSATECAKTAEDVEQRCRGLITILEKHEQKLEMLRDEYHTFRARVRWAFGLTTALVLIGAITWILQLRG